MFLMCISTGPSTVNNNCDWNHNFNTNNNDADMFNGLSNGDEPLISVGCYYHINAYTWKVLMVC